MKILQVLNSVETFFWHRQKFVDFLLKRGHEVVILVPSSAKYSKIEDEGYTVKPYFLERGSRNPLKEFYSFLNLFYIYLREKPNVIHHYTVKPILYGSLAAFLATKKVSIINGVTGLGYLFTSNEAGGGLKKIVNFLYKITFMLPKTFAIFENADDQKLFCGLGILSLKNSIVINGAGVDISTFQPSFEKEGCVNILFIGRLLRDKGIIEFLKAAKGLKKSFGEAVNFLVLGDVDSNPTSIKPEEIEDYVHQKIIQWHGYQEDIKEFLKMASVVCLPSYREGLPMALLEGASAGKPLVATNVPGCKEVIIDGTNGFLVKRECVLSLEKALAQLVKDKALRDRMGKASRKLAESRFSSLVIFPRIESVYQNTLVR